MRVALVQLAAVTDAACNRDAVALWFDRLAAAPARPDLVVFPEAAMHDFGPHDLDLAPVAEDLDGPFVSMLADQARRLRCTVVAAMFERASSVARPYNTLVAVSPGGELVAAYRKIHLYDSFGYRESDRFTAGDIDPVVVPVADRQVGLMTCYDLRFPELARALVSAGADTLCVPAAWVRGPGKEDHWSTLLRARAIENVSYVLGCGQCGATYVGASMVVGPTGAVVASAGPAECLLTAELDGAALREARQRNPALTHRRVRTW